MRHLELQNSPFYEFGPFRLAPDEHRLYRDGEVILLPPKEFDLLLLLVQNSGQVMNRESLIKALWPNTVVEEANLNVQISALRKALAENQGEQRYIETLPRLGYRFIAAVTEVNESDIAALAHLSNSMPQITSAPAPSISLENGANYSQQNGAPSPQPQEAKLDWYSRHRMAML